MSSLLDSDKRRLFKKLKQNITVANTIVSSINFVLQQLRQGLLK